MIENEMVGWHHTFNRVELEQAPGDGEGQRSLVSAVHGITKMNTTAQQQIIICLA